MRLVLLLWALGYQLDHAWLLAAADSPSTQAEYERALRAIDDEDLLSLLETTAAERGDGREPFVSPAWSCRRR